VEKEYGTVLNHPAWERGQEKAKEMKKSRGHDIKHISKSNEISVRWEETE